MARSREYAKQAFRLVDRVSEYERAEIDLTITGPLARWTKRSTPGNWVLATIPALGISITNWASSTSTAGNTKTG